MKNLINDWEKELNYQIYQRDINGEKNGELIDNIEKFINQLKNIKNV